MMGTGKMTIVVALVHTVYLRGLDTERFTLEDGKMTKDTYVAMSFTQCKELFFLCLQYTTKVTKLRNELSFLFSNHCHFLLLTHPQANVSILTFYIVLFCHENRIF